MKDQIQFETNGLTVLAVKVDKDDYLFSVCPEGLQYAMRYMFTSLPVYYNLPSGNWKLHASTHSMTEKQAKVLVEYHEQFINGKSQGMRYKDYKYPSYDLCEWYSGAIYSGISLLRSHGIDPNDKYVLLIKVI